MKPDTNKCDWRKTRYTVIDCRKGKSGRGDCTDNT